MANSIINTQEWKLAALNLKRAVFNSGFIALNTDVGFVMNFASTTADITEPGVGGYARETPNYGTAVPFGVGDAQLVGDLMTWNFLAGGFTIYHVCQLDVSGNLLWAFKLNAPAAIPGPGPWQFIPTYADGDF